MPKIKVLRVIARMNVGGPAFLVRDLMEMLDPSKFEQLLIHGDCEGKERDIPHLGDLRNARRLANLGRKISPIRDLISLREIVKIIKVEKPDIIDTHTFKAGFLIRCYFLFFPFRRVRLVHHYHGHLLNGYFSRKTKVVYRWIEIVLSKQTDILISDGDLAKDELIREGIVPRGKFVTIRPGIHLIPSGAHLFSQTQPIMGSIRDPIVAFVGRLAPIKRPDRYLQVVHELTQRNSGCTFKMYGEGELLDEIESEISARKLDLSLQPFEADIFEVLKDVDILVMTSDNEGTPLTVMQASSAGVPCVGTNVGSMRDIVIDGVNGFLVNPDYVSITTKIQELVSNPSQLEKLQESSILYAEKNFDIANYIKAHEEVYLTLTIPR
jgi:glycosyltransferase involved in cell wall biosynthesis